MNCSALASSDTEVSDGLWAAKILLLLRMGVRGSMESQENSYPQNMKVTRSRYMVDKTSCYVCLW